MDTVMPNPLLRRVPKNEMNQKLKLAYEESLKLQTSKGGDATFFEIGANAPELMEWYSEEFYGKLFYGGRVDIRTKELMRYRLSMTHGCAFCNKGNIEDARSAGITEKQLDNIMNEASNAFSEKDVAVLKLVDEIVLQNMNGNLSKNLYDDLKKYFSDAEIFELGMVASLMTGMAKFLFVFDLVEKEKNGPIVAN